MSDLLAYREFKLGVPIWDISDDDCDSPLIRTLFTILSVTPLKTSLLNNYDSFYDYSAARYNGDPNARCGRGDILIFVSDSDDNSFIAIDMFEEATDSMNLIGIEICAPQTCADEIAGIMQSIRSSAEVSTALLDGNLGLREDLAIDNFPRLVPNHDTEVLQHAQVYRGGSLIHATKRIGDVNQAEFETNLAGSSLVTEDTIRQKAQIIGTQIFQVTDAIWCIRRPSYQNCSYLVLTSKGPVLIDAGMASDGRDIDLALAKLNLSHSDIRAILLTHWHNDHAAGAAEIQARSGAPVYCHVLDKPNLTRVTSHNGFRGWLANHIPEWGIFVLFIGLLGEAVPRAVESPEVVCDSDTILEGFTVIETPGHTPGHISFYYAPEKALFAGDALAVIGERIRFMARPVTPDHEAARDSMIRCLSMDIEVLCPGHRHPLTQNCQQRCDEMLQYIKSGGRWPILG
ncbi:MBL fold metallo-hydrolase [Gimesia aquarii]|uniref:Putative metallo-hydrolase YflN n=1 Tax=Gimesia aquarii TaxID=2527964 RepID=A0A517W1W7_9PLAN|nr:MBL fold metallo-hydrolase [Gimesia aquarii]QDT99263.1 putative metallo-hydrolase YflN [Gimesia aquarii]